MDREYSCEHYRKFRVDLLSPSSEDDAKTLISVDVSIGDVGDGVRINNE